MDRAEMMARLKALRLHGMMAAFDEVIDEGIKRTRSLAGVDHEVMLEHLCGTRRVRCNVRAGSTGRTRRKGSMPASKAAAAKPAAVKAGGARGARSKAAAKAGAAGHRSADRIRAVAIGLFKSRGYHGTSVRALAFITRSELRSLTRRNQRLIVAKRDQYERKVRALLEAGVRSGDFEIPDIKVTTIALLTMCSNVPEWFARHGRLTPVAVADRYADMAMRLAKAR